MQHLRFFSILIPKNTLITNLVVSKQRVKNTSTDTPKSKKI